MKTLLYCYRSGVVNNVLGLLKAGVYPQVLLTAPPLTGDTFPYHQLEGLDLAYIVLHGLPGLPDILFGDNQQIALLADKLGSLDLSGVNVILEGCWGMETRFPTMFLAAGAKLVVASKRENYDRRFFLGDAGKIGSRVVSALRKGQAIEPLLAGTDFVLLQRSDTAVMV